MTLQQLRYVVAIAQTRSMNEAAKSLFVSQPSLSQALRELEQELNIAIFHRSSKGVTLTEEGEDFLGYCRQVLSQVDLLEDKYQRNVNHKKKFGISTQHYSFVVEAFVEFAKLYDMEEYQFAIRETKTIDVIKDVQTGKSQIGILYKNQFNEKIIDKVLRDHSLTFTPLIGCKSFVYLAKTHPLAKEELIQIHQLENYPCLSFEQGEEHSFYFAEEVLSTYDYPKTIKANDRATMLNLMVGLNGYTLCSGIISENLNGSDYITIPLETDVDMEIGYILRKDGEITSLAKAYLDILRAQLQVAK